MARVVVPIPEVDQPRLRIGVFRPKAHPVRRDPIRVPRGPNIFPERPDLPFRHDAAVRAQHGHDVSAMVRDREHGLVEPGIVDGQESASPCQEKLRLSDAELHSDHGNDRPQRRLLADPDHDRPLRLPWKAGRPWASLPG